jgi:ubiquinone/menaquinone biosynthesis C-methylase UbiE
VSASVLPERTAVLVRGDAVVVADEPVVPSDPSDDRSDDGVFHVVRDGYEAVYDALPRGASFNRIWRENAYRGEFPVEFAHIGFLTETEGRRLLDLLGLRPGDALVDLACGAGGPGLWAAQQSGASVIGVDPASAGLTAARQRASAVGLGGKAQYRQGTFEHTGLDGASADAAMTIEAFQYAPDKRAALAEFARILKPGARVGIVCFEVDPDMVHDLPVLGVDPVADYSPLLTAAGFDVVAYEETPGWAERVYGTFQAVVDAADALNAEMGERAAAGVLSEAMLTVAVRPYPRRVLIAAARR